MKREVMFNIISDELAKIKVLIGSENSLNLNNKNIFLEDIMANIFNMLYDLSLINTNLNISNYASIDLHDTYKKTAIQVTTNVSRKKIQDTLDTFFEKNYEKEYEYLYVIVFDNTSYRGEFTLKNKFEFTISKNIITYNKLLTLIKHSSDEVLEKIYHYVLYTLKENIYNVDWTIKNTSRSLNNLGKRYNKKLNVFNKEESKLKMFFLKECCKENILKEINDLIIYIENNDVKSNINLNNILLNFNTDELNKILLQFEELKSKVISRYQSEKDKYNKIYYFQEKYNEVLNRIKILIEEFYSKVIVYEGVAGIGKSHTLAYFVNEYYIKNKLPAILILGQDFSTSESIESQIIKITNGKDNIETFLCNMNQLGIIRSINIPIIIDGLNECSDNGIWKRGLINFIELISNYSNLKLVLSIRDTYYNFCIPEELKENKSVLFYNHDGFSENNMLAKKQFFDSYGIKLPIFQTINNEFDNPLFLTTYCEIVKKYHIDVNEYDYKNFVEIYEKYIVKMDEKFKEKFVIMTSKNVIEEILSKYIEKWLEEKKSFTYEEILQILAPVCDLYSLNKLEVLNYILDNGLFYKEIRFNKEVIIFAYERYEKISIARYLVNQIANVAQLKSELNDGFLHQYIDISTNFDNGVLEELVSIIQIKYKVDFLELIDFNKISFDYYLKKSYIKNLIWFNDEYDVDIIKKNIKELYKEDDYQNDIINILIKTSYLSKNPLNIVMVDKFLANLSLKELDYYWTIIIDGFYTEYSSESIDNIINYCLNYGNEYLDSDSIYLISKLLSWLLSSTNHFLRDNSTKALTKILLNNNDIALKILNDFSNCSDMYILERIIAAIYGSVLRSTNNIDIDKLSQKLYSIIYQGEKPLDNIIIKIYAVKYFRYIKEKYSINLYDNISKEQKSKWYEKLPTNEDIDLFKFSNEECSQDKRKYENSRIINSMITEYGRGTGGYGDFGRYTLQPMLKPFEYLFKDIQLLANMATKRVFDYGYDYKLFAYYDEAVKYNQDRHEHSIERIGKKYQWIATYELLSKLYDNYTPHYDFYSDDIIDFSQRDYFDDKHEKTTSIDKIRYVNYSLEEENNGLINIDTTNFIVEQSSDSNYLDVIDFNYLDEENYFDYIIKTINSEKYISLFNLFSAESRKYNLKNVDRNSLSIVCTAFLYSSKDKLKNSDFKDYSQGTYNEEYNIQLYDIPFSSEYILNYNRKFKEQNVFENFRTCYDEYIWEGEYDNSIKGGIKIVLPQKWIIEKFKLSQKEEGKWYKEDKLFCFQPDVKSGNQELVISYDEFIKYVKEEKLNLGWTIFCEKTHNNKNKSTRLNIFYNVDNGEFEKDIYDTEEWESSLF